LPYADIPPANLTPAVPKQGGPKDSASLYFGADLLAGGQEAIAPWRRAKRRW